MRCVAPLRLFAFHIFVTVCRMAMTKHTLMKSEQMWVHRLVKLWRHYTKTLSTLLALSARNPSVSGGFPAQRPLMRSCDVSYDAILNKQLNKQSWGRWIETSLHSFVDTWNNYLNFDLTNLIKRILQNLLFQKLFPFCPCMKFHKTVVLKTTLQ